MRQRRRVFSRGSVLYIRFRDADGHLVRKAADTADPRKAEELAIELEAKALRQRRGLEPLPPTDGGGTLWSLVEKWLATLKGRPSYRGTEKSLRKHLFQSPIADRTLATLRPGHISEWLAGIERTEQTKKHLRGYLNRAFELAAEREWWTGPNPVAAVPVPKVPKSRVGDYLRLEEIPEVLAALDPEHRAMLAASLYTGLRKGELCALQKRDVDLVNRRLVVGRSWNRDTTKGGTSMVIPIHSEAVPWFEQAMKASTSYLVFPREDGKMRSRDTKLADLLRRALVRAGIVDHYLHRCRKHGCKHQEQAPDAETRRCPKHWVKLWAKPVARRIRWHDTRHSAATLLLQAGASIPVVQRVLRHQDPKLTTNLYGHLEADWLGGEIERLTLNRLSSSTAPETAVNRDEETDGSPDTSVVEATPWLRSSSG